MAYRRRRTDSFDRVSPQHSSHPPIHLKRLTQLHYRCDIEGLIFWIDNALPSRARLGKWDIALGPEMHYLTTVKNMSAVREYLQHSLQSPNTSEDSRKDTEGDPGREGASEENS